MIVVQVPTSLAHQLIFVIRKASGLVIHASSDKSLLANISQRFFRIAGWIKDQVLSVKAEMKPCLPADYIQSNKQKE